MTAKLCITCMRSAKFVEGCSHVDCPQRKPMTAQQVGDLYRGQPGDVSGTGRRCEPTTKDAE